MPDYPDDDSLFVRVEGYKVILQDLEAVRQILENMQEAVHVLNQVEDVKEQSIKTFLENVDRLNDKLESIEGEMPRLKDLEGGGSVKITSDGSQQQQTGGKQMQQRGSKQVQQSGNQQSRQPGGQRSQQGGGQQVQQQPEGKEAVDDSIRDLHDELKGLKDELNDL